MDEELIKICDCVEVQGKRQLNFGDKIYCPTYKSHGVYMGDGSAELETGHAVDQEILILIPRIEDVFEWLGDKVIQIHQMSSINTWKAYCSPTGLAQDITRGGYEANTPIKALLKAFIHLEHDKESDG